MYLVQIKDLYVVTNGLRSDNGVVLEHTDFSPDGGNRLLWKTSQVVQASILLDLNESSTISLTDDGNLSSGWRSPPPHTASLTQFGAHVGVRDKVSQIDVVALEGGVSVELDLAFDAWLVGLKLLPDAGPELSSGTVAREGSHLGLHESLVHNSIVVVFGSQLSIWFNLLGEGERNGREGDEKGGKELHCES